jgi:hypothetical protein
MTKTGSEGISEMVGPAASTSLGAFSCTYICEEDELWPEGELPEDWAAAWTAVKPRERKIRAVMKRTECCNGRGVMNKPCLQV